MSTRARFRDFLSESLETLAREMPDAYGALCRKLDEREVAIRIGRERVGVVFSKEKAVVRRSSKQAAIEVTTSRAAILDLIDANTTMIEAVLGERLGLRGSLGELARFHDGLAFYLHGAMRAPSFPGILRRYRHA